VDFIPYFVEFALVVGAVLLLFRLPYSNFLFRRIRQHSWPRVESTLANGGVILTVLKQEEGPAKFLRKSSRDFQTAQRVNFARANLFELVAKNLVSPRRGSVLAHIGSPLLRARAAIDCDREANLEEPLEPKPKLPSMPDSDPAQKPS
jgi:hypothetical protein